MSEHPPQDAELAPPEELHRYAGDGFEIEWRPARCIHSARCVQALPAVFNPRRRPWIVADAAPPADVMAAVRRCPSGALQLAARSA